MDLQSPLEKIARTIADQYGISVVFHGGVPCTDGKTIFLPNITDLNEDELKKFRTFIFHEVAHVMHTDFPKMKALTGKFHQNLFNALEDSRIEIKLGEKYLGARIQLEQLNEHYRGKIRNEWAEYPMPIRLLFSIRGLVDGIPLSPLSKEEMSLIKKIVDAGLIEEAKNSLNTKTTIEVTKKMIDLILKEEEKEEAKKSKKKKKSEKKSTSPTDEEGEGGNGESDDESGEGSSTSEESEKKSDEPAKEEKTKESKYEEVDWSKVLDIHSDIEKIASKKISTSTTYIPFTTKFDREIVVKNDIHDYKALKNKVIGQINSTVASLERVLKVQDFASYRTEQERGRLDVRSFHKLLTVDNFRGVFKDKKKTETKNVAIEIMVDLSGSMMSEARGRTAEKTVAVIAEALSRMGINFEVTGFNSTNHRMVIPKDIPDNIQRRGYANNYYIFKSFDSRKLDGIAEINEKVGGENVDGESVMWAAKRLAKRKEKRKVFFILSDGEPLCPGVRGNKKALEIAVKNISKAGIEVVAIGIQTESVAHYYPKFIVVNDIKTLAKSAINELRKILEKGK